MDKDTFWLTTPAQQVLLETWSVILNKLTFAIRLMELAMRPVKPARQPLKPVRQPKSWVQFKNKIELPRRDGKMETQEWNHILSFILIGAHNWPHRHSPWPSIHPPWSKYIPIHEVIFTYTDTIQLRPRWIREWKTDNQKSSTEYTTRILQNKFELNY